MKRAFAVATVVISMLAPSAPGFTDPPIRTVSHPGGGLTLVLGGLSLACPTYAGGMVWWTVTYAGGPVGLNTSRGGVSWTAGPEPLVFLRADIFATLPPTVQLYIALHECAHFHLAPELNTELNADCWTVRTALANRWLSDSDLDFVRKQLAEGGNVAQWGHPGSLIHHENIRKCLSGS